MKEIREGLKEKLTLNDIIVLNIFYFPNNYKYCSYPIGYLIKKTRLCRRTLLRILKKLLELNLIRRVDGYPVFYEPIPDDNLRNFVLSINPIFDIRKEVMKSDNQANR